MRENISIDYHKLIKKKDEEIIESIGMAEMPLILWIMKKKYIDDVHLIDIGSDCMIRCGETNVANMSYLATYIHFLNVDKESVNIVGNISFPAIFSDVFSFFILVNNEKIPIELKNEDYDRYVENEKFEIRNPFEFSIRLTDNVNDEKKCIIKFGFETDGISSICNKLNCLRFSPISDLIYGQYYEKDGWIFSICNNEIICTKASDNSVTECESFFRKNLKKDLVNRFDNSSSINFLQLLSGDNICFDYDFICDLRDYYFETIKQKTKPIWIFIDRPQRADDNARVLFEYVQQYEKIDSYFLISDKTEDYSEISKIGKTIPIYSKEHFQLALIADCIISSQCNGMIENPFWDFSEYFRDLYHRPKRIFLQHGIIKDDMSITLNRYNTDFTGFITSVKEEYDSILEYPYSYTKNEVWLTGLPRYDKLYNQNEKIILVMPSWRKNLMEQIWDEENHLMKWSLKNGFNKSAFYREYFNLLTNRKLQKICKEYGYRIIFKAHPLMNDYINGLNRVKNIEISDKKESYRDVFAKGSLLITDYSSVAFDFSYLKKPVIYYQFDEKEFFNTHTYQKGFFDYEKDGLGEVVYNSKDLINLIIKYIKNNCEIHKFYERRIENFYEYKDNNNCLRVFNNIMENI